jgi:hypothetical protein
MYSDVFPGATVVIKVSAAKRTYRISKPLIMHFLATPAFGSQNFKKVLLAR